MRTSPLSLMTNCELGIFRYFVEDQSFDEVSNGKKQPPVRMLDNGVYYSLSDGSLHRIQHGNSDLLISIKSTP